MGQLRVGQKSDLPDPWTVLVKSHEPLPYIMGGEVFPLEQLTSSHYSAKKDKEKKLTSSHLFGSLNFCLDLEKKKEDD